MVPLPFRRMTIMAKKDVWFRDYYRSKGIDRCTVCGGFSELRHVDFESKFAGKMTLKQEKLAVKKYYDDHPECECLADGLFKMTSNTCNRCHARKRTQTSQNRSREQAIADASQSILPRNWP